MSERLITCKIPRNSEYESDHCPIISAFNSETIEQVLKPRCQFEEINVKLLCEVMLKDLAEISALLLQSISDIDKFLEVLVNTINKSIMTSILLWEITVRSKLGLNTECKVAQMRSCHLLKCFN